MGHNSKKKQKKTVLMLCIVLMIGSVIIFMVVCQECPSELMTALKFLHMCQIPESKLKKTLKCMLSFHNYTNSSYV